MSLVSNYKKNKKEKVSSPFKGSGSGVGPFDNVDEPVKKEEGKKPLNGGLGKKPLGGGLGKKPLGGGLGKGTLGGGLGKKPLEKQKEEVKEEPVEEIKENPVEEVKPEEPKKEKKNESKAKSKSSNVKTKAKKEEVKEENKKDSNKPEKETNEITDAVVETLYKGGSGVRYDQAIQSIRRGIPVETEWLEHKEKLKAMLDKIKFSADMTDVAIKKMIAELDKVRDIVAPNFTDTKVIFEELANKEVEGLIDRVKILNSTDATNEIGRKRNGVLAVMNFKTLDENGNDITLNLYDVYSQTKERYYFYKGLLDVIDWKANRAITMQGANKNK